MKIKIYLDEDVQIELANSLRRVGIDAITTKEMGNLSLSDLKQLEFSTLHDRTILTFNKIEFIKLHLQ